MSTKTPITVAYGDGIGPEIMNATLQILDAAGAPLAIETIEIGEKIYLRGNTSGIEASCWESLLRTRVLLKAPVTTPPGGGFKSLNVTMRKALGLYANVRPCVSFHPFIDTMHPGMNVVIVRENEEDLYTGIEYRLTPEVASCMKLISRPGSEKIIRYAFEYARLHNRKKVSCFMKDSVMKLTDGLFHKVFDEIGAHYPEILKEVSSVDMGAGNLAETPEAFDVIVMPNLYGDILSDVAAHIAGSLGLAGSANVGDQCAMFEAMHGSAPRRAGQNLANPSGLLMGAVLMLVHLHMPEIAGTVHNAWLRTIEDGIHTYDVFTEAVSTKKVGTKEFAGAVIARLGHRPITLEPVTYSQRPTVAAPAIAVAAVNGKSELKGIDLFVYWPSRKTEELAARIAPLAGEGLRLQMIDNRGVQVWPDGHHWTFCTDSYRCRFVADGDGDMEQMVSLMGRVAAAGIEIAGTQTLRNFEGVAGYSPA